MLEGRLNWLPHSSQVSKCLDKSPGSPSPSLDPVPAKDKGRPACALALPPGTRCGKPAVSQALCTHNLGIFVVPQECLAPRELLSTQPCNVPCASPNSPTEETASPSFDDAGNRRKGVQLGQGHTAHGMDGIQLPEI